MNDAEVGQLLVEVQAIDNRVIDRVTLEAWRNAVGALNYGDAVVALRQHRQRSAEYLQPAHIVQGARLIANDRHERRAVNSGHHVCPSPLNIAAMSKAWNKPVEFAREREIYFRQLRAEGHASCAPAVMEDR